MNRTITSSTLHRATLPAVAVVYAAALLQGLTLVSFPALSGVLKTTFVLSDAAYGAIFLPQVGAAVVGSLFSGALALRIGLKVLLVAALATNTLSQITLYASPALGYPGLLLGTGLLGLGFGLAAAPLNGYPPLFFAARKDSALVALHTLLGVGLAAGPLLAGQFAAGYGWQGYALLTAALALLLTALGARVRLPPQSAAHAPDHNPAQKPLATPAFWLFAAIGMLYAFAEGTFSNWAVIYLADTKHLSPMIAAFALSAFWATLALGRLGIAALVLRVPAVWVWRVLPILMIAVFVALPQVNSTTSGIVLFALAGLACSAFFPLTISLAAQRFPTQVAWVSSMLTAALMVGVGLGSWAVGLARDILTLEQLYVLSAGYPAAAIVLMLVLGRNAPRRDEHGT